MSTCECSVFMPIKKSPFGVRCAFGNEYPRLICHELIQFLKVASFQFKDDCTPVGSPCAALQRHTLSDWNRKRERCYYVIVHIFIEILPQDKLPPGLNENLPLRSVTSNKENEVGNTICT